jgi:RNA polymerase sigma-70 factor, ECF subfamily
MRIYRKKRYRRVVRRTSIRVLFLAMDRSRDPQSDADLILRARDGDVAAFVALAKRHEASVWRIARQTLLETSLCENLVQQVFLNVFEHLNTYDGARDFGIWLRSIARNLARDELRKAARANRNLEGYHHHLVMLLDDATDELQDTQLIDLQRKLVECQEQLAPGAREAIRLRYVGNMALSDVALAIGRSVTATRQLLFRTRVALRNCVEGSGFNHERS